MFLGEFGFCADSRRELGWGCEVGLVLGKSPRERLEEGGQLVFKELCVLRFCGWIMGG
jgi:hypothetical protein